MGVIDKVQVGGTTYDVRDSDIATAIGFQKIDLSTATAGKYVNASGGLSNGTYFAYMATGIPVKSGDTVLFHARGYSTTVAMIYLCDQDGSNRVPVVMSNGETVQDYTYIVKADGYVGLCYYVTSAARACITHLKDGTAVHYTAQELTAAQQEQARVNAGVVNARGMVNYGYDTPGSGTAGTSDATRIAYTRVGTLLTLNGTSTSIWRLRISGTPIRTAATPPTSVTAVHIVLNPAHDYRFILRLIGGTCTRSDDSLKLYLTPYKASSQTQLAARESWQDDSGNYYRMIPASTIPSDGKVSFLLSTGSGTTFTNAVFEAVLEDVTERTGETGDLYTALEYGGRNLAPSDTPTAANTHTAGSLLTVSGQLYKATQAIAAGETITPGTNVTETTVAAQLAERDTAIAAVEADAEYICMEPWQMMCKKYFITAGSSWLSVSGNRLVYNPTSGTGNVSLMVIVGEYASRASSVSGYTPLIGELVPVSVFGDTIKMGFYSSSDTSGRYPRLCYKFCTVSGDTVTPISGAYGLVPDEAANNALAEKTVSVPEGATHVFFGVYFSGYYAGTYDMVYKVDKG